MSGPPNSNGIIPTTIAPPQDIPPTSTGYGTAIGAVEYMDEPGPHPSWMEEAGLASFDAEYEFEEYALEIVNGEIVKVDLSGDTINWSQSSLDQSGDLEIHVGVEIFYSLVGKTYTGHQYTFLTMNLVLVEAGVEKPTAWTVRMKHFS